MKINVLFLLCLLPIQSYGIDDVKIKVWQEDINVYVKNLQNSHIDLYHSVPKITFNKTIKKLTNNLATMSHNQILVAMMKITHSIGDGHTSFPLWNAQLNTFPIQLSVFDHELYVVGTTQAYKHLLGYKLEAINNIKTVNLYKMFASITPFSENKYSTKVRVAEYITKAELLNGFDVISDKNPIDSYKANFTFSVNNNPTDVLLTAEQGNQFIYILSYRDDTLFTIEEKIHDNLWFSSSNNKKSVYVKFKRYTSIKKMESLAENILSYIDDNQSEKLIIDMRDNYGGDFFVGLKLAQLLVLADSIDWKSGVYVLINNGTFSAAMSNAAQFSQLLNAKLVGEPTGAVPSGYQDMGQFILPNSALEVTFSKRLYHFREDSKDALYPDVSIELTLNDYIETNDKQLKWVLDDAKWK